MDAGKGVLNHSMPEIKSRITLKLGHSCCFKVSAKKEKELYVFPSHGNQQRHFLHQLTDELSKYSEKCFKFHFI